MKLTLYSDYSLRVLLYLGSTKQETVTIDEIADFYMISRNHLVKVVHNLGISGFILTARGKHGGIKLARSAAEISIGQVVRHTEPDFDLLECFNSETDHCVITQSCRLKAVLYEARSAFIATLDKYTLADAVVKTSAPSNNKSIIPIVPL